MGFLRRLTGIRISFGGRTLSDEELARLPQAEQDAIRALRQRKADEQEALAAWEAGRGDHPKVVGRHVRGRAGEVAYGVTPYPDPIGGVLSPEERERVADAERADRDAARAPYRAPDAPVVAVSRVATRAGSQWEDVARHLGAIGLTDAPHLVFGAYRVPDRIKPGIRGDRNGVVEWDVVHAADGPRAACGPAAVVRLDADRRIVARRPGEPSVLDEEVAIALLAEAGIGPERALGVSRDLVVRKHDDGNDGSGRPYTHVVGISVLVPTAAEAETLGRRLESGPVPVPVEGPPDVHVAVLAWEDVSKAVHRALRDRPRVPSPFPHLPLTPQELIRAYIEVVGLDPADSYGVAVTNHDEFSLLARSTGGRWMTEDGGEDIMCADGEARRRLFGGDIVVLAYRDRAEYADGRARWAAYQDDVLRTALERTRIRRPVPSRDGALLSTVETAYDVAAFVTGMPDSTDETPPRYCWPPVD